MPQRRQRHAFHVVGGDESPALEQGRGASAANQRQRPARAAADRNARNSRVARTIRTA
jgi:hypothetical protein